MTGEPSHLCNTATSAPMDVIVGGFVEDAISSVAAAGRLTRLWSFVTFSSTVYWPGHWKLVVNVGPEPLVTAGSHPAETPRLTAHS
jgi:hypothetical protein